MYFCNDLHKLIRLVTQILWICLFAAFVVSMPLPHQLQPMTGISGMPATNISNHAYSAIPKFVPLIQGNHSLPNGVNGGTQVDIAAAHLALLGVGPQHTRAFYKEKEEEEEMQKQMQKTGGKEGNEENHHDDGEADHFDAYNNGNGEAGAEMDDAATTSAAAKAWRRQGTAARRLKLKWGPSRHWRKQHSWRSPVGKIFRSR